MKPFALALPLGLLAACSNEPDVKMENASISEVAEEMQRSGSPFLTPGKWQHTITLVEVDMPGMPPDARSMMQQAMDQVQKFDHCLTAEESRRPSEDFFAKTGQYCRYEHFNWGNGTIDLKLNCSTPQGRLTQTQVGAYQGDSFTMESTQLVDAGPAGGGGKMTIRAKVEGKRVGDCEPKEKTPAAS